MSENNKARSKRWNQDDYSHPGNAVYGLGFIGALVFYVQQSESFWSMLLGFLKALVWPAMLVYDALKAL